MLASLANRLQSISIVMHIWSLRAKRVSSLWNALQQQICCQHCHILSTVVVFERWPSPLPLGATRPQTLHQFRQACVCARARCSPVIWNILWTWFWAAVLPVQFQLFIFVRRIGGHEQKLVKLQTWCCLPNTWCAISPDKLARKCRPSRTKSPFSLR